MSDVRAVLIPALVAMLACLALACGGGEIDEQPTGGEGITDGGTVDQGAPGESGGEPIAGGEGAGVADNGPGDGGAADAGPWDTGALDAEPITERQGGPDQSSGEQPPDGGSGVPLANLIEEISASTCKAIFRCCDKKSLESYFAMFANSPNLTKFKGQLPPEAALTAADCPALMEQMLAVIPFGDWIKVVKAGEAAYNPAEARKCLDVLDKAKCGDEVVKALFDGTCVSFAPPSGGKAQRKMFNRTRTDGDKCTVIRDGVGTPFFGSCDPMKAFCCYPDRSGDKSKCSYPTGGATGTCKAAPGAGEQCKGLPPILICKTGSSCDSKTSKCVVPSTTKLTVGDPCMDTSYNTLGICVGGWCDSLGSKTCKAKLADGEKCTFAYQCKSGGCENKVCGKSTFCTGP